MKTTGIILSSFIIIVAGVVLCILNSHPDILVTIVRITGTAFALAGLLNIILMLMRRRKNKDNQTGRILGWISGTGGLLLGCAMMLSPLSFTPILVFVFGVLLILGGLSQIYMLAWGYRPYKPSGWMYVLPVLQLIGGIIMICSDTVRTDNATMLLITGIGFIFYGLTTFTIIIGVAGSNKNSHTAENNTEYATSGRPEYVADSNVPVHETSPASAQSADNSSTDYHS